MRIKFVGTCLECSYELGGQIASPGFSIDPRFPAFIKSHCPECHAIIISEVFTGTVKEIEAEKQEEQFPSKTQVIGGKILDHFTVITDSKLCTKDHFYTTTDVLNEISTQGKKKFSLRHVGLALRQLGIRRVKRRGVYGWYLLNEKTPEA